MFARLTIVRGAADPPEYDFSSGQCVTLGRSQRNNIVLRDHHASRKHAQVYFEDGHWYLRECKEARNGTRVNSVIIEKPVRLVDGQEIGIAELCLRFNVLAEPTPPRGLPPAPAGWEPAEAATSLHLDELVMLHDFMSAAVEEPDWARVVRRALLTVRKLTGASLCGYLSLDQVQPFERFIEPEEGRVNAALSRQLTQRVQKDQRRVWLNEDLAPSERVHSLAAFHDAVCVPLRADGAALGALHVYKTDGQFTHRQVRFCEMVAGFAASHLALLQQCRSLEAENSRLRGQATASETLVGDGPAMRQLRHLIAKVAPFKSTVLIQGETGSGKDLVALALHRQNTQRRGPFVVVNCGAIAPTLLEAELFGHHKGAFTGAVEERPGYFQQADGGTLFLDEIGDMPAECQVKVLRAIEGNGFRPVGADYEVRPDVRVVAATNKDLAQLVKEKRFREDLYFRLNVIQVHVPPLRDRLEDVPAIAAHFVALLAKQYSLRKELSPAAVRRLSEYHWPGNVRRLRAVLENAVILSEGERIEAHELPLQTGPAAEQAASLNLERLEEWAIRQALRQTEGNVSAAAKIVGISRDTMTLKIKKYGIDRKDGG